ncbi:Remorin 4.1, partial [Thalictrum thalictroides]
GGGFSPAKLRNMLLGIDKKQRRGEQDELESTYSLRSEANLIDNRGVSTSEDCKDVDIVSELVPDCSTTSNTVDTLGSDMSGDRRLREHVTVNSRIRGQEEGSSDYDSGYDSATVSSSAFEFQKTDRAPPRQPFTSKPTPSKWDDAQKWIQSPTSTFNRNKTGQPQVQGVASRKTGFLGYSRQSSTKIVVEVPEQRPVALEEPDTKRIDSSQLTKKEDGGQKFVSWVPDQYPIPESYAKPAVVFENSVAESAISLSQHDSSISSHSATTYVPPPSTVRSVSMRDMGTEMTPIASQEPSRTGTPVRATTPTRSPTSSRPSTPGKAAPASSPVDKDFFQVDSNKKELSEKEIQKRTRREIMALGTQLGKMNIAAWASKEEEEKDASSSMKTAAVLQTPNNVIETRAAAWEEAEKAKYIARYKREDVKIEAWENHEKAKMEAEMRKVEVEVERMRVKAHERLMEKLATTRHKAEEKRAAAETKRNRQAAKTEQQAEYIRRTGRLPSFSCCNLFF